MILRGIFVFHGICKERKFYSGAKLRRKTRERAYRMRDTPKTYQQILLPVFRQSCVTDISNAQTMPSLPTDLCVGGTEQGVLAGFVRRIPYLDSPYLSTWRCGPLLECSIFRPIWCMSLKTHAKTFWTKPLVPFIRVAERRTCYFGIIFAAHLPIAIRFVVIAPTFFR